MKPVLNIKRLSTAEVDFWPRLQEVLAFEEASDAAVVNAVREIIAQVRACGDAALLEYTQRFDRLHVNSVAELEIPLARRQKALDNLPPAQRDALESAAKRIQTYHEHQKPASWSYTEIDGTLLGQQVTPLDRAGLYVPGGKAAYPSSVLMNAIPAKIAGVGELIMCVPAPDGAINDLVLAAAHIAKVDRVFTLGGAQAIAALAYGTASVPRVDKIVGPGNAYVACAKRMVFGTVGIDMIAGPSEILVVCDGKTSPDWIAMDLFSQAEHDEDAQAILVSPDADFLERVDASMERLLPEMERSAIIKASLRARGAFIHARNLHEAMEIVNFIAPEHLELSIDDARDWAARVRHAGAIFVGRHTSEAVGDYCAGPNHVLPTSRTARFSSPLSVSDFQKRSSLVMCSPSGAAKLGGIAAVLAQSEGLTAHARSAQYRIKPGII